MEKPTCSDEEGCDRPARARGLCEKHYQRQKRLDYGTRQQCCAAGCSEPFWAKGLCGSHYMQGFEARRRQEPCSIKDCPRPWARKNWCAAHYYRWRKYGDPIGGGPMRAIRGTGDRWLYDEQRRLAKAKMSQVTGETAEYVKIIRLDPCVYCGAPCEHIDHIIPFAGGGVTEWINLAPTCAACNYGKSRRSLLTFLLERVAEEQEAAAA